MYCSEKELDDTHLYPSSKKNCPRIYDRHFVIENPFFLSCRRRDHQTLTGSKVPEDSSNFDDSVCVFIVMT